MGKSIALGDVKQRPSLCISIYSHLHSPSFSACFEWPLIHLHCHRSILPFGQKRGTRYWPFFLRQKEGKSDITRRLESATISLHQHLLSSAPPITSACFEWPPIDLHCFSSILPFDQSRATRYWPCSQQRHPLETAFPGCPRSRSDSNKGDCDWCIPFPLPCLWSSYPPLSIYPSVSTPPTLTTHRFLMKQITSACGLGEPSMSLTECSRAADKQCHWSCKERAGEKTVETTKKKSPPKESPNQM